MQYKNMKRYTAILIYIILICNNILFADTEIYKGQYIKSSHNQKFYFKMYTDSTNIYNDENGFGLAYEIKPGNKDSLLWTVSGWYSYNIFLSNNGNYLVRKGHWPDAFDDPVEFDKDLAVAFYNKGKLLKSYYVSDIVKDISKIQYSVSHYSYSKWENFNHWRNEFTLITNDDMIYTFDISTGEIISKEKDSFFKRFNRHPNEYKYFVKYKVLATILLLFLIFTFLKWLKKDIEKTKIKRELNILFKWFFSTYTLLHCCMIIYSVFNHRDIINRSKEFFTSVFYSRDSLSTIPIILVPYFIYSMVRIIMLVLRKRKNEK